jgi:hypothetical protein
MTTREEIKKEVEYLIVSFPSYNPVLDGEINVISVFLEKFSNIPTKDFHQAIQDLVDEEGRKYAPSIGEIKHAIKELPYKGMTPGQREDVISGLKPMSEALREVLPDYDMTDEDALQRNLKWMEKEQK